VTRRITLFGYARRPRCPVLKPLGLLNSFKCQFEAEKFGGAPEEDEGSFRLTCNLRHREKSFRRGDWSADGPRSLRPPRVPRFACGLRPEISDPVSGDGQRRPRSRESWTAAHGDCALSLCERTLHGGFSGANHTMLSGFDAGSGFFTG